MLTEQEKDALRLVIESKGGDAKYSKSVDDDDDLARAEIEKYVTYGSKILEIRKAAQETLVKSNQDELDKINQDIEFLNKYRNPKQDDNINILTAEKI